MNTTLNQNDQSLLLTMIRFTPLDIILIALITAIFCIGIPGNLFVIYVFGWRQRRKRCRFKFLLLILGCVDLISLLLVPPSFFYLTVTKFKVWHFGNIACKILPSLMQVSISVSQGMLVLICYERYSAIVNPFHNKQISTFRIFAWLCNVVFMSVVFIYPYAYTFEVTRADPNKPPSCQPKSAKSNYLIASSCLQVFRDLLSVITMVILSLKMNKALVDRNDETSWDRAKMSAKSRKLLRTVVVVFTMLCLPVDLFHIIYYALVQFGFGADLALYTNTVLIPVNTTLNVLQISNSVVNVFIYSKMHVFFRKIVVAENSTTGRSTKLRKISTVLMGIIDKQSHKRRHGQISS